jgi:hypothetical protein
MVEASVVLPMMVLFLGMFTFVKESYNARIRLQNESHEKTLYNAAHSCSGGASGAPPAGGTPSDCSGGAPTAQTGYFQTSMTRQASVAVSRYSRSVRGGSWFYCDEKPQEGFLGWFRYAGSLMTGWRQNPGTWFTSQGCK